ncbi:UNVERIFIED_CONTAM: protein-disulfide reductase DsbD [Spiribacter pallidus]
MNRHLRRLARFIGLGLVCLSGIATAQQGLSGLFDSDNGDVLPVEQAFAFELITDDASGARLKIAIAEGYYLYQQSLAAGLSTPDGANPDDGGIIEAFPGARIKQDEFFGRQPVYTRPITLPLDATAEQITADGLVVAFQGCAEAGVCYPPYQASFTAPGQSPGYAINPTAPAIGKMDKANASAPGAGGAAGSSAAPSAASAGPSAGGEAGRLQQLLAEASLPAVLGGFFAAGLLLAFTACLYPMIPILSGLIAGDPHRSGSLRALGLSLIYVESTAITYAIAGVAAGLTGAAIQADLQSPWVLGAFAAVFVLLALGMFGVYEFRMPAAIQTRLTQLSNRQRGGTALGVAIMGVLSTLIVGACSGPALVAALVFIGSTGDAWLGGLALFTLANGMGLPLLLIGTAAGRWLPRSGPWMNAVRAVFGVGFLAVALWMLERFIPGPAALALWGVLLVGCGVWLGALTRPEPPVGGPTRLARTLGIALLIWGAASLVGAAGGGRDVLQPLAGLSVNGSAPTAQKLSFRDIDSVDGLQTALADARAATRPVMIDIYADWCIYCVQLEERTFTDPAVREAVAEAMLLRADVTDMTPAHRALMRELDVYLPPAIIFYDADGREAREERVVGFLPPADFIPRARRGLRGGDA